MKRLFDLIYKSSVLSVSVLILFSCSQKLTRAELEDKKKVKNIVAVPDSATSLNVLKKPVGKCVVIDTLLIPMRGLQSTDIIKNAYYTQRILDKVTTFYHVNRLSTVWFYDHTPSTLYYAVIDVLKNASRYGLRATDYDVNRIQEKTEMLYKQDSISTQEIVQLDIRLTEMYFLFTTHLAEGKILDAGYGKYIWKRQSKGVNTQDVTLLLETRKADDLATNVCKLQPANSQYAKLTKALKYYHSLDKNSPSVAAITINGKIKPGEINKAIPQIRRKLSLTDLHVYPMMIDTVTCTWDSLRYDQELTSAVKVFQIKHGLDPDGIIGEKTLKFLNQTFQEKADVIALNMERLRWLPEKYSDNYIRVNVPEYKLRVYENDKPELEMRVIVGAINKPTPIFSDELEHIVFSPTWTVPVSIIKEEIIPRLKNNPAYYTEKNYSFYKNEVEIDPTAETWDSETINPYQYRIVQKPGPDNSLGLVKFVMPNNMSVYMHDTPNHRLFAKDFRALSHGCVRLSEPAKFAEYLLRDQKGWTSERISKAMNDSRTAAIHLKKHYDVHLEYCTAWVDDDGQINFREDIYGHDKVQLQQLYPVEKPSQTYAGLNDVKVSTVSQ